MELLSGKDEKMRCALKKFGLFVIGTILTLYVLFLILPIFLTGIMNSIDISKMVEEASGFKVKTENVKLITTPKLTAGVKLGKLDISLPTGEKFFTADNVQGKLSLLPLILKKIELDMVGAENLNINLKVKKDGHFLIEDFFQNETGPDVQDGDNSFGFKLSDKMPDIIVKNYNISLIDIPTDKSYSIYGDIFSVKDFVLNKKIRITTSGNIMLIDKELFKYDINFFNTIMPDMNSIQNNSPSGGQENFNIIGVLNSIYKNQITAEIKGNISAKGSIDDINLSGNADISNLSAAVDGKQLPKSSANFNFAGQKIKFYSKLYTAEKDLTEIIGYLKTGKHPSIELNCKSNAKFQGLIDLVDSFSKSFGNNQFDTLSATGGIDADFTLKSNMKKLESSGYLKIPSASLNYKLYNILIDKIFANIEFANNAVEIKDAGFSVLNQPLKINGNINSDANVNINILADKLPIKGLLLACGQTDILNLVNSGVISANAHLKGRLDKLVPSVKIDINNLKIINPTASILLPEAKITLDEKDINLNNTYILLNNSKINIFGKIANYLNKNINFDITAKGNLLASDVKSMIPKDFKSEVNAKGAIPLNISVSGNNNSQDIKFTINSNPANYVSLFNIEQLSGKNTDIKGVIKITGESMKFADTGVFANGVEFVSLKGGINNIYKTPSANLNVTVPSETTMSVPFMKNSKMRMSGSIDVLGSVYNPVLKGNISVPLISMPDMLLTMKDMAISLNGQILNGKGVLKDFVCGGIVSDNINFDFNLKNNIFYLKNLVGNAFEGKYNGSISYNLVNGNIGVNLKGFDMNAEKSIQGAAGLKNALSGRLNFSANVTTKGETDVQIMKNLKGKASFEISDGEFGNIGRFENYIFAQNLLANPIIKSAVNSVKSISTVKNTAKYKSITGNMTFNDGWVNLQPIKTSGPSMSSYVTGKYNLLNATANLVILGRISSDVVKLLGPLGDLSLSKLTSLIPGIGNSTASLVQAITTNPYGEKISEIPQLSSGNTNYKDFKVQFNGGVESSSSVKSFKWLSVCDTSQIDSYNLKDQVKTTKQAIKETAKQQVDNYNKKFEEQRQQAQQDAQQIKDAVNGLKNLFK